MLFEWSSAQTISLDEFMRQYRELSLDPESRMRWVQKYSGIVEQGLFSIPEGPEWKKLLEDYSQAHRSEFKRDLWEQLGRLSGKHSVDTLAATRRIMNICERLYPEDLVTLIASYNLGIQFQKMGDYEKALPRLERSLEICEKLLGPKHSDTAIFLNDLGEVLKNLREYERALPLFKRCLQIREELFGPEHPDTVASLNNLGVILQDLRDYEGARLLFERYLQIRKKQLGPEHLDIANSLNDLGRLLQKLGDYEDARPLFERCLRIREKQLGSEHLDTIDSLTDYGYIKR